jgi:hypothetical protein
MNIQTKHKLWMWGFGLLLAALYFGPSLLRSILATAHAQGGGQQTKTPQPPQVKNTEPPKPPDPLLSLVGNWKGRADLTGRGVCTIGIAIQEVPGNHDQYAANSGLSCVPTLMEMMAHKASNPAEQIDYTAKAQAPTSTILTGTANNGTVVFHVDQNIGVDQTPWGCNMTSLTVKPMGATPQILIEWKETDAGVCHGGQIVAGR